MKNFASRFRRRKFLYVILTAMFLCASFIENGYAASVVSGFSAEEISQKFERAKELGEQERQRFAGKGKQTDLYWEIPFECDLDETAFTIYLMHYYGIWNRKVKIETFEVQM